MAASRVSNFRCFRKVLYCTAAKEAETPKEPFRQRMGQYFKRILEDYKDVAVDAGKEMKVKPFKSTFYITSLITVGTLLKTNPNELSYRAQLLENNGDLLLLSDQIRNPESEKHIRMLFNAYNEGLLRRWNLGVCSIMWLANHDKEVASFEARCKQLKPRWVNFQERIVDVGVFGRWVKLREKMNDFDINVEEWKNEAQNTERTQ